MSEYQVHEGGLVGDKTFTVRIHPDECIAAAKDVAAGRFVCSRPEHEGRACQGADGE